MEHTFKTMNALFLGALLAFASCGDDAVEAGQESGSLKTSVSALTFESEAATQTFEVTSTAGWTVFADQDWVTATQSTSQAGTGTVSVTVTANSEIASRTANLTVKSGTTRQSVTITQKGKTVEPKEDPTPGDIECPIAGYSLVWNDEFEGTSLNTDDWTYETGGGGWGNGEIQNYAANSKVATVSDGTLKINLFKDGNTVYSARIKGHYRTGWKYGYIEARLKLPKGKGTWPAFWMMPVNYTKWPGDGEIDIMEEVGYAPNKIYSTIHCTRYNNGGTAKESGNKTISTAQTDFHTYGMEWTSQKMDFYIDGTKFFTYKNDGSGVDSWPFDRAFYPILNLAWGGAWGGAQGIDESCLPAVYEIDYIRVFQK